MYEDLQLAINPDENLGLKIKEDEIISANLEKDQDLDLQIGSEIPIDVNLEITPILELTINDGGSALPYYEGPYRVIPRKVEQTLETQNKSMKNDVVVDPINYLEVSNPQGGKTVTIGYE